jgi:hypothetical protein
MMGMCSAREARKGSKEGRFHTELTEEGKATEEHG